MADEYGRLLCRKSGGYQQTLGTNGGYLNRANLAGGSKSKAFHVPRLSHCSPTLDYSPTFVLSLLFLNCAIPLIRPTRFCDPATMLESAAVPCSHLECFDYRLRLFSGIRHFAHSSGLFFQELSLYIVGHHIGIEIERLVRRWDKEPIEW